MAVKRFGPTRGAGVVVQEVEGEKTIEPGALGMTAFAGILEKGPVGELITCFNKTSFFKQCGSRIADSLLPDACEQFFQNANGAGALHLVRVTDGNEAKAQMTLFARYGSLLTPMGTVKAHNGGRWGGKLRRYTNDMPTDVATDLDETTLNTGVTTWPNGLWKGGWLTLKGVANTRYPIIDSEADGTITVAADQTMLTDMGVSTETRYYLELETEDKAVSIEIVDGEDDPATEFGIVVYVDGEEVYKWANLSTDPTSGKYWVDVINETGDNYYIEAVDLWTGAHTAAVRPANHYGLIDTITDTVLTAEIYDFNHTVGDADATITMGTTTDEMIAQKITIVMTDATTGTVTSDKFGDLGDITEGAAYTPNNKWAPPFQIDNGVTVLEAGDTMVINYKPFVPDALIGGYVYPDKANAPLVRFRIVDNDHDSITAADGSTMTDDGAAADEFMVVAPMELEGGIDGNADLVDADYTQQAFDTDSSPFNRLFGQNYGLVKLATPNVTATAVVKAGIAYAAAKNYQFRVGIPSNILTEIGAIDQINTTIGRSDYAVASFPSWGYYADPDSTENKLKLVPLEGQIMGREARIAVDYDGYHKAAAGVDAILPHTLKVTTGDVALNEEVLNPAGISVIKKVKGNFVIWGDRTLYTDPAWKWKHQREYMSHTENVLRENFDWIVFAINDPETEKLALAALRSYFYPEWTKRALRGDTFDEAATIKIDAENNTDLTRAAGDMFADIRLRIADTVERFIMRIGKMGIFDSVG